MLSFPTIEQEVGVLELSRRVVTVILHVFPLITLKKRDDYPCTDTAGYTYNVHKYEYTTTRVLVPGSQ